jgi:hypothetical protein
MASPILLETSTPPPLAASLAPPATKARIIPLSNNASLVQVAVARPYLALACKYFQEFIGSSGYLNGWSAGG